MDLFPVGLRPKCRCCSKELAPQYKTIQIPYELWNDPKKKAAFKAANPKQFTGNYGYYSDNKFCGMNCGYCWAVRNAMGNKF